VPAGPINLLAQVTCPAQRAPGSPIQNRARGFCPGQVTCSAKSPTENCEEGGWPRGTGETRGRHRLHQRRRPSPAPARRGPHSFHTTHMEACEVHFQRESSKFHQPRQGQAVLPHLECMVSSSSFSKHVSELFLQVKLHRSKEKSGDRTRRSIQTPRLIKHPIHNRLH